MEFNLGYGMSIHLPPLHITIIAIIIIVLLWRWSKQLEKQRFSIFFYFLISTFIFPIYSHSTESSVFELWIPAGFIFIAIYLYKDKERHPVKVKASLLGLAVAIYQLVLHYF